MQLSPSEHLFLTGGLGGNANIRHLVFRFRLMLGVCFSDQAKVFLGFCNNSGLTGQAINKMATWGDSMNVKSGAEIVDLHSKFQDRIRELEEALLKLDQFGYTKSVLQVQLTKLREELRGLEDTRFQAMEPVTIVNSALGGHDYFVS